MRLSRLLSYEIEARTYVILRGGLGNQLHQIAAGVKFSERRGGKVVIYPRIVDTANNLNRRGFFREIELNRLFPQANIRETNRFENAIFRLLNLTDFKYISRRLISEENFLNPPKRSLCLLKSWFQSFEYVPSQINFLSLIGAENLGATQITIHIRLTDFSDIDLDPLGQVYYSNALSLLHQANIESPLRCFSDDIKKARVLLPKEFEYEFPETHETLSASKLLNKLSASSTLICSKSSLCWWAANAVSAKGGVVISPWTGSTHKTEWLTVNV